LHAQSLTCIIATSLAKLDAKSFVMLHVASLFFYIADFASWHFGKNSCNVKATILVVQFHLLLLILAIKVMVVYKYLMSFVTSIVSSDVLCLSTCVVVLYVFDSHFSPSFGVMPFASQIGESINFNFNHMASAFEICDMIDLKSLISELVLKCHFLEINNK